ncbi:hypothetical protein [Streptomyces sp. NPDC059708]|uniref:hypothetical protein n=1 Tax=Streptomyces sp. NPDC059708 TaxID=3346916 RepID=UPI0036C585CE
MADASDYEKALTEIRTTHAGRPAPEVKTALLAAGEKYGVRIANEVAQDAAERIADGTL